MDLIATARDRYKRAIDAESDNRKHALECVKFRNLEQWDTEIKRARETDPEGPRPCTVVDKTNQYLRQVCNDERQNRPAIKVRPVDDKADPEVAEVFQGIVRHIEDRSGADIAYDTAYEHAAEGGFGYFRVLTEYEDEASFQQDIVIKRIRNRFQVVLDPDRQEPDGSDAKYGFVIEKMPRDEYKASYPKASELSYEVEGKLYPDWVEENNVIVAEYFRVEKQEKTICLWKSGRVTVKDEEDKDASQYIGDSIIKERKASIPVVKWSKINAVEELESRDWLGKYIPIVEVIGNELDIEGKSVKSGLMKGAMEPQRIHNYASSSFIENVALAPRAPWVAAEGQIEGHENDWRTANRRNLSVLTYKPVVMEGNVPVPPPLRQPPPGIPAGWQQTLMNTEHDIQASMGMYNASLGADSNEKSGVALQKKQREADTATFHYMDNLSRSIRYLGRILVDLIPKVYDTERVARILGDDGKTDQAMLNPNIQRPVIEKEGPDGKIQKIYNLGVGKYDVTVSSGPSYTTKRQEALDWQMQAVTARPELLNIIGDIMFRNMDAPGADKIADRLKKMLPPPLQEPDEGEQPMVQTPQGPIPIDQAGQVISQLTQQLQQASEAIQKAEVQKQANEAAKIEIQKFDSETKRISVEADAAKKEAEIAQMDENLKLLAEQAAANAIKELLNMNVIVRQ